MRFLRSVVGYRSIDHRRNKDIRQELQIMDINSRIEDYQNCFNIYKKRNKTEFLNYYWTTNPDVEETRDVHVEDGENSFEMFTGFNFKQIYKKSWRRNRPLKSLSHADDEVLTPHRYVCAPVMSFSDAWFSLLNSWFITSLSHHLLTLFTNTPYRSTNKFSYVHYYKLIINNHLKTIYYIKCIKLQHVPRKRHTHTHTHTVNYVPSRKSKRRQVFYEHL
jgi:hypothetical protein